MPFNDERAARRLLSIVENIDAVREFVGQLTREQFLSNKEKIYAVIRALEIISEASRHVPEIMKARHPHLPWEQIKAAGNFYRHEYDGVSLGVIWDTVEYHLDPLRAAVAAELDALRQ